MQEIHQYLKNESKEFKKKSSMYMFNFVKNTVLVKKVTENYNQWLCDLKQLISNKLYRQTLREIEANKNKFELVKKDFWKYRLIKAKVILKIIKIKMKKHNKEIIIEFSKQNTALKFWFNQMFIILEELILEFRYDINTHIDYNSKKILDPVLAVLEYHIEFIYYLCIFALRTNEIIPLIAYISITEKFLPYIPFISKAKILHFFQNIILLKIKLLIESCEFLSAFENIKILIRLCIREMHLLVDYDYRINYNSLKNYNNDNNKENENKTILGFCRIVQNLTLGFFLKGVACEHLGLFKLSIHSYKQCRFLSNKFLYHYNKGLFNFFRKIKNKYIMYKGIFDDIRKQILIRNKKKIKQRFERIFIKKYKSNSDRTQRNTGVHYSLLLNKSEARLQYSCNNSCKKKEKLISLLENIGNNLYKEEEYRNNSIFNKFTVNSFVLSTVNMINNLLSDPFNPILNKMEKVEITKPNDEISHLINWTLNFKRQNEFKKKIEQINNKRSSSIKKYLKNKSCIRFNNNLNNKINFDPMKPQIKLCKNIKISKDNEKTNEKSTIKNSNDELNISDNILKIKVSLSNNSKNKSNKKYKKISRKIEKFTLNRNVFSKSLLSKKNYLDSFYEKELNFQKRLLKLKGCNIDKNYNKFNQQNAINSAEQEFKILQSTAQSKNKKNNLMNLVKNFDDFHKMHDKLPIKQLIDKNDKKRLSLKQKKIFKLINNHQNSSFDPNNVSKSNELNMEYAELELKEQILHTQRKNLMNKLLNKKNEKVNK